MAAERYSTVLQAGAENLGVPNESTGTHSLSGGDGQIGKVPAVRRRLNHRILGFVQPYQLGFAVHSGGSSSSTKAVASKP